MSNNICDYCKHNVRISGDFNSREYCHKTCLGSGDKFEGINIPAPGWKDVRELLVKYSQYLQDCGYLDDDWWSEEPISVDRFLAELPSPPEGVQG